MKNLSAIAIIVALCGCLSVDYNEFSAPQCENGIRDGDEAAVDCGGHCGVCDTLQSCVGDRDCDTGFCYGPWGNAYCIDHESAPLCGNRVRDTSETDIDCGGLCAPCAGSRGCADDTDCESGLCVPTVAHDEGNTGRCWGPDFSGCAEVDVTPDLETDLCGTWTLAVCQLPDIAALEGRCVPPEADNPLLRNAARYLCCDPDVF